MFPTSSHTLGLVTSWGHSWMVLGTLGSMAWLEDVTQSDLAPWYLVSGHFLSLTLLFGYHKGRSFNLPHINALMFSLASDSQQQDQVTTDHKTRQSQTKTSEILSQINFLPKVNVSSCIFSVPMIKDDKLLFSLVGMRISCVRFFHWMSLSLCYGSPSGISTLTPKIVEGRCHRWIKARTASERL